MRKESKFLLVINLIFTFIVFTYFILNILNMYNFVKVDDLVMEIVGIISGLFSFICLLVSILLFSKLEAKEQITEDTTIKTIIEEELKTIETESVVVEEESSTVQDEPQEQISEEVQEEVEELIVDEVLDKVEEPIAEEVVEEQVIEEVQNVEIDLKPIDFSKIKYEGKLMYSSNDLKERYSVIKNHLLSYSGVSSRISNNKETFRKSGIIAQIRLVNDKLYVYLAVIPEPFIAEGYKVTNVSNTKQYEETPTLIKISNDKTLKQFVDILDVMMTSKNINKKQRYKEVNYKDYLHLNGETILNGLGFSSEYLVSTINSKIISKDLPDDLIYYASSINGNALSDEVYKTTIYLDNLCSHFNDGDIITKKELVSKKLIKENDYVVIKGRGTLDKKFIIHADDFDVLATKMIYITNGTIVHIKH